MLDYLNPKEPIFINGFPTFEKYFRDKIFKDVIVFKKVKAAWRGKIKNYPFIGLPFLNRPRGGKEGLVKLVRRMI